MLMASNLLWSFAIYRRGCPVVGEIIYQLEKSGHQRTISTDIEAKDYKSSILIHLPQKWILDFLELYLKLDELDNLPQIQKF